MHRAHPIPLNDVMTLFIQSKEPNARMTEAQCERVCQFLRLFVSETQFKQPEELAEVLNGKPKLDVAPLRKQKARML
jgi:hypothetical protein